MTNTITFEQAVAKVGTPAEALKYCNDMFEAVKHSYPMDWTFDDFLEYMDDMLDSWDDFVAVVWHVATGKTNQWVETLKQDGIQD